MDALSELHAVFGTLVMPDFFRREEKGVNSRKRVLPPETTFWAFLSQALHERASCRDAVRRLEAWWRWSGLDEDRTGRVSDEAYCQARARLPRGVLEAILRHLALVLERNVLRSERPLKQRRIRIVDGTGLSMPDTAANQAAWPQSSEQKPGLGFPILKLVGLFDLASGALQSYATGTLQEHDATLFRTLWADLERGDVIIGDRAFCSYTTMASLRKKSVDGIWRLHQARKVDFRRGEKLGVGDRLVTWNKPLQRPPGVSEEDFRALPATLSVRLVRTKVEAPGQRDQWIILATTLTDAGAVSAEAIRELYARRWQVELHFAQIKTTLGLDILRCKSPEMVEKEVLIHLIAYNLIRSLMQSAAHHYHQPMGRVSFKGTMDTVRAYARPIHLARRQRGRQQQLIAQMLETIASDTVPERPGRTEPRARKRRPKSYQLLTKPRHQMKVKSHRNRPKHFRA